MSADFSRLISSSKSKRHWGQLRIYVSQLDGLLSKDVGAFNELLRKGKVSNLIARVITRCRSS
jgi:hypothetical protein